MNYTFIIPHHNAPELLNRCLNSIPIRPDIQIIVIDDNSSPEKKPNIEREGVDIYYIDSAHSKGAGHARNVGMEHAKGKWLLFADCDDFYYPGAIDILDKYREENIQILFFSVGSANSDTLEPASRYSEFSVIIQKANTDKEALNHILYYFKTPWYKMLSTKYVKDNNFQFEEVPRSNDAMFTFLTSYFAERYKIIDDKLYCVTIRQNSLSYKVKSIKELIFAYQNILKQNEFYKYIDKPHKVRSVYKAIMRGSDDPLFIRKYMENKVVFTIVRIIGHISYSIRSIYVMIRYSNTITCKKNFYVEQILKHKKIYIHDN